MKLVGFSSPRVQFLPFCQQYPASEEKYIIMVPIIICTFIVNRQSIGNTVPQARGGKSVTVFSQCSITVC